MKLITEPTVYLLGKQSLNQPELTRFLKDYDFEHWSTDSPSDAETLVEIAARSCYQSFKSGRPHDEHIRHILEVGHGSVTEHAVWNLLITGVSRSLTHELIRHRHMSPSQLSQRYVDESETEVIIPSALRTEVKEARDLIEASWHIPSYDIEECDCLLNEEETDETEQIGLEWIKAIASARQAYFKLTKYLSRKAESQGLTKTEARKYARQAARSVLPNATETKIFITANTRAFRNAFELRCSRHADPEIRLLFNRVYDILHHDSPNLFGDYTKHDLDDGTFELTTEFKKV